VDPRPLEPFAAEPQRSALLFDVDGTLAPIVVDPGDAAVPSPTASLLEKLEARYALVACISGRRALEARRIVGIDSIAYVGNHGLELLEPGAAEAVIDPALEPLAAAVTAFAKNAYSDELKELGVRLEDKDAIWVFHWRGAPHEEAARTALSGVASEAEREGLVPHWGRKVLEVRPPVAADKGAAVATALDEHPLARALYAGDDTTDLDAFRKLRALASEGRIDALCVGVRSSEGPEAIVREADVVVEGPEGVAELLDALA
jgi:trehalose 6-phosphate phosphatase